MKPSTETEFLAGEKEFHILGSSIAQWLDISSKVRPDPDTAGLKFNCAEDVVLKEGDAWGEWIDDCPAPPMVAGNCFANAFELTLCNPLLTYCEGWAMMEGSMPVHHGWVVDHRGNVIDPTWLTVINEARVDNPGSFPNRVRAAYLGVQVPIVKHVGWFLAKGTMNVLSCMDMTEREIVEKGAAALDDYEVPWADMPEAYRRASTIYIASKDNAWSLDKETGIFHRPDGARWCGRTQKFL